MDTKRWLVGAALCTMLALTACAAAPRPAPSASSASPQAAVLRLPAPALDGTMTLEHALARRQSVRAFAPRPLTTAEVSRLLWVADGVTRPATGGRTAPSASAVYPLELFAARADGLWRYRPKDHSLLRVRADDVRAQLAEAASSQSWIAGAPLVVVIAGEEKLLAAEHGSRAERFMTLEAGHVCQNLLLEATALGLGGTSVGSVSEEKARPILRLPPDRSVLYVVPVGAPR